VATRPSVIMIVAEEGGEEPAELALNVSGCNIVVWTLAPFQPNLHSNPASLPLLYCLSVKKKVPQGTKRYVGSKRVSNKAAE